MIDIASEKLLTLAQAAEKLLESKASISRVSVWHLPQLGSNQCGHCLQPIRLRLQERIE